MRNDVRAAFNRLNDTVTSEFGELREILKTLGRTHETVSRCMSDLVKLMKGCEFRK